MRVDGAAFDYMEIYSCVQQNRESNIITFPEVVTLCDIREPKCICSMHVWYWSPRSEMMSPYPRAPPSHPP